MPYPPVDMKQVIKAIKDPHTTTWRQVAKKVRKAPDAIRRAVRRTGWYSRGQLIFAAHRQALGEEKVRNGLQNLKEKLGHDPSEPEIEALAPRLLYQIYHYCPSLLAARKIANQEAVDFRTRRGRHAA